MEELKRKANKLLDDTVNFKNKYLEERKLLYFFLESKEENEELLEYMLKIFNRIIELEKEQEFYENLKTKLYELVKQEIRKRDSNNNEKIHLFEIKDKNEKIYTFFNRENAKSFIKDHKSEFDSFEIEVVENNNVDLQDIVNSIK